MELLERSEIELAKNENYKISVLMPTYNDAKYLGNAISSVVNQTYKNWELIIVDDGSTYETAEIVETFDDSRIKYLELYENRGQLNALAKAAELVEGEYVTLLHSDDEFSDKNSLERTASLFTRSDCEGVYADILKMNEKGEFSGTSKVVEAVNSFSPALLFLRGASNFVSDVFFVKREAFSNVVENYINWNMPYWLKFSENAVNTLSLLKVHPWYKYRVYTENYACSDIGKFEVTNGCLRAVIEIGSRIHFPFFKVQKALARVWAKSLFREGASFPKQLLEMTKTVIQAYYGEIPKNAYFNALLGFYTNYPSNRTIEIRVPSEEEIFLGRDARRFYGMIENDCLSDFYANLLEEASQGFGSVNVTNEEDYQKIKDTMRFLNLYSEVKLYNGPIVEISPEIAFQ
ncbi:glycosyltransferase family 2 protein [Candidatus Bathyarchaeota archaeon A05DMB-2]|nr:glycosyltransferase family 2 protein [Candidatus Bathyarchaeota archaeon A05DMB-2]